MKIMSILVLTIFTVSCAQMKEAEMKRLCNYEGAYNDGHNDAQKNEPMNSDAINTLCSEETKAEALQGYREGYKSATPAAPLVIINNNNGRHNNYPPKECREKFGEKICGYNCVEAYGEIKCAQRPDHICLAHFSEIKCGKNCKVEYGNIKCENY